MDQYLELIQFNDLESHIVEEAKLVFYDIFFFIFSLTNF